MKIEKNRIEVMSPVGSFESLAAAIQAGADAVYFGIGKLNMRSRSSVNFSVEDLEKIVQICTQNKVRSYLTVNTIIFDDELQEMKKLLNMAKRCGVSAIIASDLAVIESARQEQLEVHISTQCNITNSLAVKFFSQYADVMVLAREMSLRQVKEITQYIYENQIVGPSGKLVQVEVFAHGALCMAVSGKCYLSLHHFNYSANRGACLQPCRRAYKVKDADNEVEVMVDQEYIMSPKDLCTIGFIDKILEAGVSVLKIEGRGRSPEYVKMVTQCYRQAADSVIDGTYCQEKVEYWQQLLKNVYNRGFWDGYYLGRKLGEWTQRYGSQAKKVKVYLGKVSNFFSKLSVAELKIEANALSLGDEVLIIGPTTGVYQDTIKEIRVDLLPSNTAKQGTICSISTNEILRKNDKVYKLIPACDSDDYEQVEK